MSHGTERRVVDEGSGGSQDLGGSSQDKGISISIIRPLAKVMSSKPMAISKTKTISTVGTNKRGMGNNRSHGTDRRVVDEGSGGSQDLGGSSQDKGISISISRPLAKVMSSKPKPEAMVANSNRDSVSSDLRADLSRGDLHTLHDRHMRDSSGSRKDAGVSQRQTTVGQGDLRVSLRGSKDHSGQRCKK